MCHWCTASVESWQRRATSNTCLSLWKSINNSLLIVHLSKIHALCNFDIIHYFQKIFGRKLVKNLSTYIIQYNCWKSTFYTKSKHTIDVPERILPVVLHNAVTVTGGGLSSFKWFVWLLHDYKLVFEHPWRGLKTLSEARRWCWTEYQFYTQVHLFVHFHTLLGSLSCWNVCLVPSSWHLSTQVFAKRRHRFIAPSV